MKYIIIVITLCVMQDSYAQKLISESYPILQITNIHVESEYANIEIESYEGESIEIEASININQNMDNEAFDIAVKVNDNEIDITTKLDEENIPKRVIMKDENGNTNIINDDDPSIKNIGEIKGEYISINYGIETNIIIKIKLPKNKNIRVKSIYGDLILNGKYNDILAQITYGNIDVVQSEVDSHSNIVLISTYGHVDYSVPKNANITFELSSSYGEIFTNLDVISTNKNTHSNICGNENSGEYILNAGNSKANVTATYADIYLRGN